MSRSYSDIEARIRASTYKTDKNQYVRNLYFLETTKHRLTRKNASVIKYKSGHAKKLARLNSLLTNMSEPNVTKDPAATEAWINETLSQGDCFYSSIFRACKERGFLPILRDTLKLNVRTEDAFVASFRNRVAREVLANHLPSDVDQHGNPEDTYDILSKMGDSLSAAIEYDEVFPDWFKQAFAKGVGTRKYFLKTFAKHTRIRKNYISEIEFQIVKKLLDDRCNIFLEAEGLTKALLPKYKVGKPLITLYNSSGGHYEYYSFLDTCPAGYERNNATRKCEKACKSGEERRPPKFNCTRKKVKKPRKK
jgi:hypothetical protein